MFGDRLKLARKKEGFSLRNLADELGDLVSAQAIGKYERGEMMPSSKVLLALSKTLSVPVGYFMSPMDARLEHVDFRKRSNTTAKERARVEAEVLQHVEPYLVVEEVLGLDSAHWDKPFPLQRLSALEDAENVAEKLRNEWDIGSDPIPDMTELLEEHGIKVFVLPLPNNVSGLTCLVERSGDRPCVPVIVVNQGHNIERRRNTLAHELAHRVIDPASEVDPEKAANRFAGAFLMPASHLQEEIGEKRKVLGYREMIDLKQLYRVSGASLLIRLEQLGVISRSAMIHAFQTVARKWRSTEPEPLEDNGIQEVSRRFERLCYRVLSEQMISPQKASELMGKPLKEIDLGLKGPALNGHNSQR